MIRVILAPPFQNATCRPVVDVDDRAFVVRTPAPNAGVDKICRNRIIPPFRRDRL